MYISRRGAELAARAMVLAGKIREYRIVQSFTMNDDRTKDIGYKLITVA
jgi:hypothetical protein